MNRLTLQEQCEIIAGYPPKPRTEYSRCCDDYYCTSKWGGKCPNACTKDQDCEEHMGDCSLDNTDEDIIEYVFAGSVEDWLDEADVEIRFEDPNKKLVVLSAYIEDDALIIDVEEE